MIVETYIGLASSKGSQQVIQRIVLHVYYLEKAHLISVVNTFSLDPTELQTSLGVPRRPLMGVPIRGVPSLGVPKCPLMGVPILGVPRGANVGKGLGHCWKFCSSFN